MARAVRVCLECGQTIREGAWGGKSSNFKKHTKMHEREKRERADSTKPEAPPQNPA